MNNKREGGKPRNQKAPFKKTTSNEHKPKPGLKPFGKFIKQKPEKEEGGSAKAPNKKPQFSKDYIPGKKGFFKKKRVEEAEKEASSDGSLRLNRYLSIAGVASRREADDLIKAGLVEVNGKVISEMGFKVQPTDVVKYAGSTLRAEKKVYLLLNKPKGFLTTMDDPKARKTVMDIVGNACKERIYPVGRLDRATTGVLLFTNDGDMAKKLTHPSNGAKKIYDVSLDKNLTTGDFEKIKAGITLDDGPITVDDIAYVEGKDRNQVGVVLHSGRNRIVRRIFEHLGYEVTKLDRVQFAGLTKKNLSRGQWRFLSPQELNFLKMK